MNKIILGLTAICVLGAASAQANGLYGTAGCGLGAVIFKDQRGGIQILAATTNNIISPQTFAITSGTSNCSNAGAGEQAALFITINQLALQKDISRGNGETLASLSKLLKCSDDQKLGATLQKNYTTIFPSDNNDSKNVTQSIDATIRHDESLAKSCGLFG